jgi:hypothetical protein
MSRATVLAASTVFLSASAIAQGNVKSRIFPVTSPIRNAGIYHVQTGTWTRGAKLANTSGPSVLYNNSCGIVYFSGMLSTERFQHRSRLPSNDADATPAPTTDSVFYDTAYPDHRYDERPGCSDQYAINGFDFLYCSSHVGTVTWTYQFSHSYTACDAADMVPDYTITVTGMPAGRPNGLQNCWIVGIDVSNETGSRIILSADGNGTYEGPSTSDQFGWSFEVTPADHADFSGPIIAGNYTWTGGGAFGVDTPCTGTDGTIWDTPFSPGCGPTPQGETEGTGMASNDFFRDAGGPVSFPSGPGCYNFGGRPHADFYLKLYGASGCPSDDCGSYVRFCAPGVGGIVTCPCGNPQIPAGATKGCNNFEFGGSGGAILAGGGLAVTSASDTLGFQVTAGAPGSVTVLFQGTTNDVNTRSGAGVRCVGGILKRLYKGDQSGMFAIFFPNNGVPVHLQSQSKGYTIVAPITLYYYCAYRDSGANGHPGCPGLSFGFNSTNAVSVSWAP